MENSSNMQMHPAFENSIVPWIGKTTKLISMYMAEKFKDNDIDLTSKQWIVLAKLANQDGLVQNELALITERDKASLTRLLSTLEKKKLVTRIPDPIDKRSNRVYLTKMGYKTFEMAMPIITEGFREIQNNIDQQDFDAVVRVMKQIQENILIK